MNLEPAIAAWQRVITDVQESLREARTLVHWGVQPLASLGYEAVEARPDFSHTSLTWDAKRSLFRGQPTPHGYSGALHVPDLALELLDDTQAVVSRFPLVGQTLARARVWLTDTLNTHAGNVLDTVLKAPDYEMPPHPIADGEPFAGGDGAALRELAGWYSNASVFAQAISESSETATPVRAWPHHFDIATLIMIDTTEPDAEKARSIGFGMSPGDEYYDEPYFYLNPWPFPTAEDLAPLDGDAIWHTDNWVGTVLPAHRLTTGEAAEQAAQVAAYVRSAMPAVRAKLGL